MKKYRVEKLINYTYQVLLVEEDRETYQQHESIVFQGNLADCEAYIRLKENGYV